jgi:4-amino-4-deoxy-L-arabinose transferase-like glycosyltransferase
MKKKTIDKYDLYIFAFLLGCVLLLKAPIMNVPYTWDGITIILETQLIYADSWVDYMNNVTHGHPPLFKIILQLMWKLFGQSIFISRMLVVIFSYLAILYTYLIGRLIENKQLGFTAACLLFLSPLYFAQSGIVGYSLPMTTFILMATYYFLREKMLLYVFYTSCAALTYEPGLIFAASVSMYVCRGVTFHKRRKEMRDVFYSVFPFLMYGVWLFYNKLQKGWYLVPPDNNWTSVSSTILFAKSIRSIVSDLFLFDFRCILLLFIFYAIIKNRTIFKGQKWVILLY